MATAHRFYIADYAVFGMTIIISICIGVYYAMSGGKQKTTAEYLMGGRSLSFLPVAISLLVSFESSIMMLGFPAETYVYGIQVIIATMGFLFAQIFSIRIIVPLLHPLKITSAYEYLEYRFQSRAVRLLGTSMGIFNYVWYMGIVLFGPAVALEAVTGFPLWVSIFTVCGVAIIYTSIGGLKAVIWTDVFQALVMFTGIFAILIKGTIDSGGATAVWNVAYKGGRLNFFNFDFDFTVRHTFWSLFFGSIIRGLGMGFNQATVQRLNSTSTVKEGLKVLYLVAPFYSITLSLALFEGIVAYAYYQTKQCDPFESEQIANPNQIIPYMVMDIFVNLPGMPGLFLASLFSASLSTLSSGLSSISALMWTDVFHPLLGDISEVKATLIAKVTVVFAGLTASGIAMLVSLIGGTLSQIAGTLLAAFGGPLSGIFLLGCLCPRANAKGAIISGLIAFVFCGWISLGKNFSPSRITTPWLPAASTDQCDAILYGMDMNATTWSSAHNATTPLIPTMTSMTSQIGSTLQPEIEEAHGIDKLYRISYLWIGPIGIIATILLGQIFSLLTGPNKPGDVDPRYLICVSDLLFPLGPKAFVKYISSIGPQFMKPEYKLKFPDPALKAFPEKYELDIKVPDSDDTGKLLDGNVNEIKDLKSMNLDVKETPTSGNGKVEVAETGQDNSRNGNGNHHNV